MPYLFSVSDNPRKITKSLDQFIHHIDSMPGHSHLYDEFDSILASIKLFRENNPALPRVLAYSMRSAVTCLVHENMKGRRPWNGEWETYFSKCMSNAHRLTKEMSLFDAYMHFCPSGYCNQFLDAFMHMDGHMRAVEEHAPRWGFRFEAIAALAAEMFFLTADSSALVMEI